MTQAIGTEGIKSVVADNGMKMRLYRCALHD